jgi:cysteine desulfurase
MVGLGKAAELASAEHFERATSAATVKEELLADLAEVEFQVNGDLDRAQPHVLNISFPGVDSEALMMALRDELAISNGSACTSSSYDPSHVLEAMGLETALIESAVRISWGPAVTTIPGNLLAKTVQNLQL